MRTPPQLALAYERLVERQWVVWHRFPLISFVEPAILRFEQLRTLKLNVGMMDLRIAAIALENQLTVVTRNLRDFQKRHSTEAPRALAHLKSVALAGGNVFEALLEASRVCSLGQMTQALYGIGGEYRRAM